MERKFLCVLICFLGLMFSCNDDETTDTLELGLFTIVIDNSFDELLLENISVTILDEDGNEEFFFESANDIPNPIEIPYGTYTVIFQSNSLITEILGVTIYSSSEVTVESEIASVTVPLEAEAIPFNLHISTAENGLEEGLDSEGTNVEFLVSLTDGDGNELVSEQNETIIAQLSFEGTFDAADFTSVPTSVSIPKGSSSATITLEVVDDDFVEIEEEIKVTLTSTSHGTIAGEGIAEATITDVDLDELLWEITPLQNGAEDGTDLTFEINLVNENDDDLTNATGESLTIMTAFSGSASLVDFNLGTFPSGYTIVDGNGAITASFSIFNDRDFEGEEELTITLSDPSSGELSDSNDSADGTISDNDVKMETGIVTGVSNSFQTVALSQTYTSPIIIATPNYNNGTNPSVTRITNITSTSFDIRLDVAASSGTSSADVYYFVVEEGVYTSPKMEAMTVSSDQTNENNNWTNSRMERITPSNTYSTPVVLGQVMSYNDSDWSTFWCSNGSQTSPPSSSSIYVGKHVGEDSDNTRSTETLGVVILEEGIDVIGNFECVIELGNDIVNGVGTAPPYSYTYTSLNTPSEDQNVAVLTQAAMDGGDGSWAVLYDASPVSNTQINLACDEDIIGDAERAHTSEQVAHAVFGNDRATYCPSTSTNTSDEWIDGVFLGDINNVTGSNTYTDYTNLSTDLVKGELQTITLDLGICCPFSWTETFAVFIDYNQDGDFSDGDETVATVTIPASEADGSPVDLQFTVPTTAADGLTRMRVTQRFSTVAGPCDSFTWGEVEDYSVNLVNVDNSRMNSSRKEVTTVRGVRPFTPKELKYLDELSKREKSAGDE